MSDDVNVCSETLADITRYIGVSVAFVGAVVVSPAGTALLVRSLAAQVRRRAEVVRGRLGKWIPWFRRTHTLEVHDAAHGHSAGSLSLSGTGRGWQPDASPEEKIERLRQWFEELATRLQKTEQGIREERDARSQAISEVTAELRAVSETLQAEIAASETRSAMTDARALPVVGLGVVLSGIPEVFASLPVVLWGLVMAASVVIAVGVVRLAARDRANIAAGPS